MCTTAFESERAWAKHVHIKPARTTTFLTTNLRRKVSRVCQLYFRCNMRCKFAVVNFQSKMAHISHVNSNFAPAR